MIPARTSGLHRNNSISTLLLGFLPAVAGSAISFLLNIFFVWGLISVAIGRFRFQLTKPDRVLAVTFSSFVILEFATAMLGENRMEGLHSTVWLLTFLSPWVLTSRLRAGENSNYIRHYAIGAAFGSIAGMLFALVQIALGWRSEGGAGNADVFAIMSLCLAAVAGLNITSERPWERTLAACGVLAGIVAIVLSLTRGVLIAAGPVIVLLILYAPRRWMEILRSRAVLLAAAVSLAVVVAVRDYLMARISYSIHEFSSVLEGGYSASVGERLHLWTAASDAFIQSPLWGYGVQNRMSAIKPFLIRDGVPVQSFTHAHNAFLSFALDGGILVVAALLAVLAVPVVISCRASRDENYRQRLFLALAVSLIYFTAGMTQIMFKHDIMDSFFIFTAILISASIPVVTNSANEQHNRPK